MRRKQRLGLDELMIVNPSRPGAEAVFLGEDGVLYPVGSLGQKDELPEMGGFFLGDDGTVYQVQGLGQEEELTGLGQFFLGEDGTLYEVIG